MGIGKNLEEAKQKIRQEFSIAVTRLLRTHINYIIVKYSNWNKYPRKVKKFLKKKSWWNLKDSSILKDNQIEVVFTTSQ